MFQNRKTVSEFRLLFRCLIRHRQSYLRESKAAKEIGIVERIYMDRRFIEISRKKKDANNGNLKNRTAYS